MYAVTAVIEDIDIIPYKEVVKKTYPPWKSSFSFYPSRLREISLPDAQQEIPVDDWIMPDQPHGYIKGRDNDIL
jgi:hypothetical protein